MTSTLIPQLEGLSEAEIETIDAILDNRLIDFFKDKYKNPLKRNYFAVFLKILKYLEIPDSEDINSNFINGNLDVNQDFNQIIERYEIIKKDFENKLSI